MPNPKLGTVNENIKKAISEAKLGQVELKNDKDGNVGLSIGKKSFSDEKIIKNFNAVMETLDREKSNNPVKGVKNLRDLPSSPLIVINKNISYPFLR